jgi:cytochrome c peroxidase
LKYFIILPLIAITINGYDTLREKALDKGLRAIPSDFEKLKSEVDDKYNPLTNDKILLGKDLFFDKSLSKDKTIACATCHNLKKGGVDSKPTAIGYKNLANPNHLNSPTVLNTAYSKHLFWDGRAKSLREQAKGPSQAPFEMASTPELIEQRVKENPKYVKKFDKVYGEDEITFDNITKAIAAYEKTLVTRGRYDEFLEGDDNALTQKEKHGLNLFIDMGCKACHFGAAVGGQKIQKFPLRDYNSIIRITSTYHEDTDKREVTDMGFNFKMYHPYPFKNLGGFMGKDGAQKFRVPILRNISKTAPYFHNGVIKTLREAISLMSTYQIGVDLTPKQLDNMEDFLKSLDGEIVDYPKLYNRD